MKHESARAAEAYPISPSSSEDAWLVKTSTGVVTWTLDELDLAFQRGDVDAATPVRTSDMTEWQTLGVVADLDAPAANDVTAPTPEPSSSRRLPPPPARRLPPPPTTASSPQRHLPPPLANGGSSPPTAAAFGNGTSAWSTITPAPEPQTGMRSKAAALPFAVRRRFGSALDVGSHLVDHLRAVLPRRAAAGPWLFGAGLSGIFIFGLYQLASAPAHPASHTRDGAAASGPAASAAASGSASRAREPAAASATAPDSLSASLSSGGAVRPGTTSRAAAGEPHTATRAASMPSDDAAATRSADGDVPGTTELTAASSRSDRGATSSRRAKARAWSKRTKARAARTARRSQRAKRLAE
jgi:hypothetical protein